MDRGGLIRVDSLYAVTIPTVLPERQAYLGTLLSQLATQCADVPIAISPHLANAPRGRDTVETLNRGAAFGCRWTVHLEDDAYLAPNFDSVVRARLAEAQRDDYPVVAFYTDNRRSLEAMAAGRSSCPLPARFLWATVCLAVRTEDVGGIASFAPSWYSAHPEHWHASDLLLRSFYAARKVEVLLAVPSPVQHRDVPTTLSHFVRRRRTSRTFKAAYGPVPPLALTSTPPASNSQLVRSGGRPR